MPSTEWIYEAAVRAAVPALQLAAPLNDRLRRAVTGRHASLPALRSWAEAERDTTRPLLWLHAPSVGEALMAQAILSATRAQVPGLQSIFTYFSPSAERIAPRTGADWHGYLPWDRTRDVRLALDAARPNCVAFVRTEVWPVLVREAAARGCAVLMVNGVLAPDSSRLGRGARMLIGAAYRRLDAVGAVSTEDAACFALLGIDRTRVTVTGDARFDQVWQRVEALDRTRPLLRPFREHGGPWLVCGSTWPADEERLIEAMKAPLEAMKAPFEAKAPIEAMKAPFEATKAPFEAMKAPFDAKAPREWRAVIAPHEPTSEHLTQLEQRLTDAGLTHVRLPVETDGDADPHGNVDADVVIVDRVGVLADLYAIADVAYVGGGFGTAGLHSVVEPAALAVPVVYGPRIGNAREAERLRQAGGAFVVADSPLLSASLTRLFGDHTARAHAGAAARRFVERERGGAERNAGLIVESMG